MFVFEFNGVHFAHKINKLVPNDIFSKHIHPFHEIYYLVKGNVTFNIESKTKVLKEGDLVIMPAGTFHYAEFTPGEDYERYVLNFSDDHTYKFLMNKIKKEGSFSKNIKELAYILEYMDDNIDKFSEEEFYVLVISELNKILVTALKGEKQLFSEKDDLFTKITTYIDNHIEEDFTIQTLCDEFHYSKTFLNELFNKHVHCPIMKYVKQKKIMYAHQLIEAGEKKNIAAKKAGFNDYSTFYRQYHSLFGEHLANKKTI